MNKVNGPESSFQLHPINTQTSQRRSHTEANSDLELQSSVLSPTPVTEVLARVSDLKYDEIGQEASEHAPVWTVYTEESDKFDTAIVEGSNRSIDVLLVFTGLFSAVLTTFIIQSYQLMIPNPMDATNMLLTQFILSQAQSENDTEKQRAISSVSAPPDVSPTMLELRWVNGLWFAALACSLSTALFSMLAKQWLQAEPNVSGSPRQRARQRQRRYMQMQTWHVLAVINALPLLLHATLLLFFAGLLVLLWTGNHAITIATSAIVCLVFTCYFGSMLLSMLYPDCPYQHPISQQLRHWITWRYNGGFSGVSRESHPGYPYLLQDSKTKPETDVNPSDLLDACSLIWLLEKCPNPNATATALQAIAGLPRSFTAFHLLRKAGAIRLVLKEFKACFHRDSTLDSHYYVTNPENAEKYCRAWMRLTYRDNTAERWPVDLLKPLEVLEGVEGPSHVKVIAACTRAIATLESRDGRSLILCYLERCTKDPLHFSHEMQCWLIDTFLQSSLVSKTCFRPKDHIVKEAIPILVYLLHFTKHAMASHVRSAVALSLSYLTRGSADEVLFNNEDKRREKFYELIIPSLSAIIDDPADYGADEVLLDLIGREFSRLTSLAFSPDHLAQRPKWHQLKPIAQRGLWKLYIDSRIKHLPHEIVADVLQIMYPPIALPRSEHPRFVKSLIRTIWSATEPQVMVGALRLLEPLFLNRHPAVLDVFIEGKGIAALLRVAHIGDTGRRRIQLDCIRNICLFIRVVTEYYSSDTSLSEAVKTTKEERLDHIFQTDFFPTLNQIVVARRWWLPEVSEIWMPALVKLCEIRPGESVWRTVESTLRKFAETNEGKHGCAQLMNDLESMQMFMAAVCDSSDGA